MLKLLCAVGFLQCVGQLLVFAQNATAVNSTSTYGSCTTPSNVNGNCVRITDCPQLFGLVNKANRTDAETALLKMSQCGADNNQPILAQRILVCCPMNDTADKNDMILPGNVIPRPGDCGNVLANRIYGGVQAKLDEFPWMALIRYLKPQNMIGEHCGGSLINHRYVLTAAHCVKNGNVPSVWSVHSVRLGEWNLDTNPDCITSRNGKKDCAPPHLDVPVESALAHELYIPESPDQFYDIALVRMANSVRYSEFIKPICLPVAFDISTSTFVDTVMDIAGWGSTEKSGISAIKLKAEVSVWALEKCQEQYQMYERVVNESQLCAGGQQGTDTCRGDSGGPLMTSELHGMRRIYYIAGIVSYGPKPCALKGWPGVYTRVGKFIPWLQQNLKP